MAHVAVPTFIGSIELSSKSAENMTLPPSSAETWVELVCSPNDSASVIHSRVMSITTWSTARVFWL
jgi:hypothetical protein